MVISRNLNLWLARLLAFSLLLPVAAQAGDLRVSIPKRTPPIPVQNLNREGVRQLKKGHEKKAKQLFYKAYLLDPNDPFTLNNLGYLSELEGQASRALRFYALASKNQTQAVIDESTRHGLQGKTVSEAFTPGGNSNLEANLLNEKSIVLLQGGHLFEAEAMLKAALPRFPHNPFLLNNFGYVMESEGDLDSALRYYSAAASLHSNEPIVLTPRAKWRGKPISEVAAQNAAAVNQTLAKGEAPAAAAARSNLRGVSALNDNNPTAARGFFLQAYRLDSGNAFTLNNLGYISELNGDRESAEMYYAAARGGVDNTLRVTYSTRTDAEGRKLDDLAGGNQADVNSVLRGIQEAKRRANRPIHLVTRNSEASPENASPRVSPPIGVTSPSLPPLPPPDAGSQTQPPPPPQGPPSSGPPNHDSNQDPQHE